MPDTYTSRDAAIRWIRTNHFGAVSAETPVTELALSLRTMAHHLEWLAEKVELHADLPLPLEPR